MQAIDFSAFHSNKASLKLSASKKTTVVCVAVGVLLVALFILKVFIIIFACVAVWAATKVVRNRTQSKQAFLLFAQANSWTTEGAIPIDTGVQYPSYQLGTALLSGMLDGHQFWLFRAESPFYPQSGRKNVPTLNTVLSVAFNRQLPRLVLVPATLPNLQVGKVVQDAFDVVPLELEGEFNQQVKTYYVAGEQVNALSYMTPDVMAAVEQLVKSPVFYNGEYVSIVTPNSIKGGNAVAMDKVNLEQIFAAAQIFIKEIDEKVVAEPSEV